MLITEVKGKWHIQYATYIGRLKATLHLTTWHCSYYFAEKSQKEQASQYLARLLQFSIASFLLLLSRPFRIRFCDCEQSVLSRGSGGQKYSTCTKLYENCAHQPRFEPLFAVIEG